MRSTLISYVKDDLTLRVIIKVIVLISHKRQGDLYRTTSISSIKKYSMSS